MRNSIVVLAACAALFTGGCGTIRGGRSEVKYDGGQTALIMTKANSSATYGLYSTTDWHPKGRFALKEGDPLGFKGAETGRIIAVAGQEEISLPANTTYYWKKVD